jgi:hypothetical protein
MTSAIGQVPDFERYKGGLGTTVNSSLEQLPIVSVPKLHNMLSKLSIFVALTAPVRYCNNVAPISSPVVQTLLGSPGLVVSDTNVLAGLTCSSVVGASSIRYVCASCGLVILIISFL